MRKVYRNVFKHHSPVHLVHTRTAKWLTKSEAAEQLCIDAQPYIDLVYRETCCIAGTITLFLVYDNIRGFGEELRHAY